MQHRIIPIIFTILLVSCGPLSKDRYLNRYEKFIKEISDNYDSYSEAQKKDAEKEYNNLNNKWYEKFEEDLTLQEKASVAGYRLKYNFIVANSEIKEMYNLYLRKDVEELKKKIEYYYKNDMKEDIDNLLQKAKETSEELYEEMKNIKKDIESEINK